MPRLGEKVRGRGLAVGTRDADHGHGPGWMPRKIVSHAPQYGLQPGHAVHVLGQYALGAGGLHEHGSGPALERILHPWQSRSPGSPQCDENVTRLELPAVLHQSTPPNDDAGERVVIAAEVEVVRCRIGSGLPL